jgi:hypothetical protein
LLTRIAAMESVSLCVPDEKLAAFVELEAATQAEQPIASNMLLMRCWLVGHNEGNEGVTFPMRRGDRESATFGNLGGPIFRNPDLL